jgi:hypothetical protein
VDGKGQSARHRVDSPLVPSGLHVIASTANPHATAAQGLKSCPPELSVL